MEVEDKDDAADDDDDDGDDDDDDDADDNDDNSIDSVSPDCDDGVGVGVVATWRRYPCTKASRRQDVNWLVALDD